MAANIKSTWITCRDLDVLLHLHTSNAYYSLKWCIFYSQLRCSFWYVAYSAKNGLGYKIQSNDTIKYGHGDTLSLEKGKSL